MSLRREVRTSSSWTRAERRSVLEPVVFMLLSAGFLGLAHLVVEMRPW